MEQYIECKQSGIFCDNEKCDFYDLTVLPDNYADWVNKPCPKCGENLLTEDDFQRGIVMQTAMDYINSLSKEELETLAKSVDVEYLKRSSVFENAKGIELLGTDDNVTIVVDTHKELRVTELIKND